MKKINKGFLFIFFAFLSGVSVMAQKTSSYQNEMEDWHKDREAKLKSENGWLNLAGLFWLKEGTNTFGSNAENQIQFPEGTINAFAGYFERKGTTVKIFVAEGVHIKLNGKSIHEAVVFDLDSDKPLVLTHENLKWTIIKREELIGIRLRDLNSPLLKSFTGVNSFPIDEKWKIEGQLVTSNQPTAIAITNVLGQTTKEKSSGKLVFNIQNKVYSLDVLEEDDGLFIIFGDATNGDTTYPSGRFLYAEKPNKDGKVIIDFNRATNPPCAFTPYATCPLPPVQNRLDIAITAGEKIFGEHKID